MRNIPPPYVDPAPLFRHGGAPRRPGPPLLDFSASINPLGPPASVLAALRESLPGVARYPDPECRELTDRLAELNGVPRDCVLVGNGSNELIYAVARALRPRRTAIAEPTFTEYLRASLLVGATVDHWLAPTDDFRLQPFDPDGADLVWACSPNNPTGQAWLGPRELANWVAAHPRTTFVLDEAFVGLSPGPAASTGVAPHADNLIVLRSLTKLYALPGLRLGYALGPPKLIERVRAQVPAWSVNHLAQVAGLAALADEGYLQRTTEWLRTLRKQAETRGRGWHAYPTATCFQLARLDRLTAAELNARLAERGLAVRDASNFVGLDDHHVRIGFRTPAENDRLFAALGDILG